MNGHLGLGHPGLSSSPYLSFAAPKSPFSTNAPRRAGLGCPGTGGDAGTQTAVVDGATDRQLGPRAGLKSVSASDLSRSAPPHPANSSSAPSPTTSKVPKPPNKRRYLSLGGAYLGLGASQF
ncbi:unnamed protein product [Cyclocybe aegerita]|uniref:Uncharacterized protein n=1 Tax=Cyclocybe aegerita TaxID=1973307 RepID=A0A8S0VRC2_CYCAE|nr:unnamed protein product [Cyclocybe aegerita]